MVWVDVTMILLMLLHMVLIALRAFMVIHSSWFIVMLPELVLGVGAVELLAIYLFSKMQDWYRGRKKNATK